MAPLRRRCVARHRSGFSLVELLVAAAVTGVVLAAAFGWLWNVAALAGRADDRAQAGTIAAACTRAVAAEVRESLAVARPPSGREPDRALSLVRDRPDAPPEDVTIVWDPSRRVAWRNASGSYLADHVTAFAVAYVLSDGRRVAGRDMETADWPAVRCVAVDLAVAVGSARAVRSILVAVGPS